MKTSVDMDKWDSKPAEEAESWKETVHLLESETMRKRLKEARNSRYTLTLEEVREKLGI